MILYFTQDDHTALNLAHIQQSGDNPGIQSVSTKFQQLHDGLYTHINGTKMALHPHSPDKGTVVSFKSVAGAPDTGVITETGVITTAYFRGDAEARRVERLMGREVVGENIPIIEVHRHPVIELRLTPEHYVVELLLSPEAWWDQRNFAGKFTIDRHHVAYYNMLGMLDSDYILGFWQGPNLSEMHLNSGQLPPIKIFDQWMSTFSVGKDWLRVGFWYETGDAALTQDNVVAETFKRVQDLYALYSFILWATDNNFRSFYKK